MIWLLQGLPSLPVGFLFLCYSVLYTVESDLADLLALGLMSNCEVVTLLLVSWVRCGA